MVLQGHQNVGELRRVLASPNHKLFDCKVTRMLVSYDRICVNIKGMIKDCKVTRMLVSYDINDIGATILPIYCKVTKMLVSYDLLPMYLLLKQSVLQGHQNVGELRLLNLKL